MAIVNFDLCKPKECNSECKKACPVNKTGIMCITIKEKAIISENLCIGCSACVKRCPFKAITIINLPTNLDKEVSHRYTKNGFKLHRLPIPKAGKVLGLVGTNGIGKSTALKILAAQLKPNFGDFENPPDWEKILNNYKGSELHGFFTKVLEGQIKAVNKIQYVDKVPKMLKKRYLNGQKDGRLLVRDVIEKTDQKNKKDHYIDRLCLKNILDRDLDELSGGELQRLSIALTCMEEGDVYIFDEPSSYLDVKQRLQVAKEIRNLCADSKYVIVVEHDLAILDLMCDYGCVLYGQPGAYGVISAPFVIKNAINIFLDGFIPTENMKFRSQALKFTMSELSDQNVESYHKNIYPSLTKKYKQFELTVQGGW